MFIQTVLQHLLGKRRSKKPVAKPPSEQELSPMAQSIMQKLAQHDKQNHSTQNPSDPNQQAQPSPKD